MTLEELYNEHQKEVKGGYALTKVGSYIRERNFVPGRGHSNGYLFVAEAPGTAEDATEEPLVGDSGKLLRKILGELDFPRPNFFTNVWKWQPPRNRTPTMAEISRGIQVLVPEIRLVSPHTIILLGNTANRALFPNSRLLRGVLYEHGSYRFMATYHPGYLLAYRNPQKVSVFKEHLRLAVKGG